MITGPDVSHHQGDVNMSRVATQHSVVICKATEGLSFVDSKFGVNRANAREAELRFGAYHFLRNGEGIRQAHHFLSVIGDDDWTVPVVDVETSARGTNPDYQTIIDFCGEVERQTAKTVVGYTYNSWWQTFIGNRPFPCRWLWIARYRHKSLGYGSTPPGQYQMFGWQYTSSGSCPGVTGNCDLNDFYVTPARWGILAGHTPADSPTDKDDDLYTFMKGPQGTALAAPNYFRLLRTDDQGEEVNTWRRVLNREPIGVNARQFDVVKHSMLNPTAD